MMDDSAIPEDFDIRARVERLLKPYVSDRFSSTVRTIDMSSRTAYLDDINLLCKLLKRSPLVKHVTFPSFMSKLGIYVVTNVLDETYLRSISLREDFTPEMSKTLVEWIAKQRPLSTVTFNHTRSSLLIFGILISAVRTAPHLTSITIRMHSLGGNPDRVNADRVLREIGVALFENRTLTTLSLDTTCHRSLTTVVLDNIRNMPLKTLSINGHIMESEYESLAHVLETSSTLTILAFKMNVVPRSAPRVGGRGVPDTDLGFLEFVNELSQNRGLVRLEIGGITIERLLVIVRGVLPHETIRELAVTESATWADEGFAQFIQMLPGTSLTKLEITTNVNIQAILGAFVTAYTQRAVPVLTDLSITRPDYFRHGAEAGGVFSTFLQVVGRTLVNLYISGVVFDNVVQERVLRANSTLKSVVFDHCYFNNYTLFRELATVTALEDIQIINTMRDYINEGVVRLLYTKPGLKKLHISSPGDVETLLSNLTGLSTIETLVLDFELEWMDGAALLSLIRAIGQQPNVKNLTIHGSLTRPPASHDITNAILPTGIQTINLDMSGMPADVKADLARYMLNIARFRRPG